MSEPPVSVATTQYILPTEYDTLIGKLASSLQPRIEQAIEKALEQANTRTDEKLATLKGEIRGEMDAKLTQHTEFERKQLQEQIDSIRSQVKDVGDETRQKLEAFNKLVDTATTTVDSAMRTIELMNETVKGWNNSLNANQQLYENNRRDIEAHNKDLDTIRLDIGVLEENQIKTGESLRSINYAIYGGTGDGPKSLFALVTDMAQKVETQLLGIDKRFTAQETISTTSLELTRTVANRMDTFEQREQQKQQRWSRRGRFAVSAVKEAAKTPYFWLSIFLVFLTLVSIFSPATLPTIIEFIYKMTNSNP
jgi:hypothetical protein